MDRLSDYVFDYDAFDQQVVNELEFENATEKIWEVRDCVCEQHYYGLNPYASAFVPAQQEERLGSE